MRGLFPQGPAPDTVADKPGRRKRSPSNCPWRAPPRPAASRHRPRRVRPERPVFRPGKRRQPRRPRAKTDSKAPAPPPTEFPDELAGGIPAPKRGLNFDRLAIDTSEPLKISGRKSSRRAGMKKEEYHLFMLYMGGGIGGAAC